MITINGSLNIKKLHGSKGAFCVGDLVTPVGTFKVKDQQLDQFEEGKYRGTFEVTQIYPTSYVHYGKVITEVRANLGRIILHDVVEDKAPAAPTPAEADPADEGNATPVMTVAPVGTTDIDAAAKTSDARTRDGANIEDAELFGPEIFESVETHQAVKLDPAVDRKVFRAQRDRLKQRGYKFEAALQTWVPVTAQGDDIT